jgi:DNA-binding NarL/FixJ family response regulator
MEPRLLQLVASIYDAAGSADRWTPALEGICDLLQGSGANLLHFDHSHRRAGVMTAARTDPAALEAYGRYFHLVDPWGTRVTPGMFGAEAVVPGPSLISHREVTRGEFYAGLGRRYGISRSLIGVIEPPDGRRSGIITINRPDRGEEFDAESARLLGVLVPHLRRALALHRRLAAAGAERATLLDVLDRIAAAVILVDARLRVVVMNRAARLLTTHGDGLVVDGRHLRAATADATTALTAALASAVAVAQRRALAARRHHVVLPKPAGGRALQAIVLPLAVVDAGTPHAPAAVVFVTDPARVSVPPEAQLRERYGLTSAEARVANALARGEAMRTITDSLHLTKETTRWYVKQVLAKTDTSRQAELVRLLLAMTLPIVEPEDG